MNLSFNSVSGYFLVSVEFSQDFEPNVHFMESNQHSLDDNVV